ncbi:MAG: DeoR/GlpR transcriptional regulator [Bacteroidales bacterium]|jgi:DeoR family transcriptional regulator of aga operon|nr:DeoR/GlpR transcriptional regulator [Bacteroidales bacterium]
MKQRQKSTTVERRKEILSQLSAHGQVLVHELSKVFNVSEVTVRNDLEQLEKKHLLLRIRGGAIKTDGGVGIDIHLSDKDKLHYQEKARIGKRAAELIKDHDTIILDSGTTTFEIAKNLSHLNNITVVCNALNIIGQLVNNNNVNLIIPGGYLRRNSLSLVGPLSEKNLQNIFVDKVFLGVDGFDTQHGIYTPNLEEAHLNELMIKNAREVIIVTDSSKFFRRSLAFICGISKIHCVVTDEGIPADDKKRLEDAGIKVIIA